MNKIVPLSLRRWFLIHFFIDSFFGFPLLFAPQWTLQLFGFPAVEVVTARLVGAALLAIGSISFLARNEKKEIYVILLKLKLFWSGAAIVGLLLSLSHEISKALWLFVGIFLFFFLLWAYYLKKRT